MQVALPLNQPVEPKAAGVAVLLLTGLVLAPVSPVIESGSVIQATSAQAASEVALTVTRESGEMTAGVRNDAAEGRRIAAGGQKPAGEQEPLLGRKVSPRELDGGRVFGQGDFSAREALSRGGPGDLDETAGPRHTTVAATTPTSELAPADVARATNRGADQAIEALPADKIANLLAAARSWLGVPYAWGGETRTGVDCSALVQIVYRTIGIDLPRSSYEQFRVGVGIPQNQLQSGDLVFFSTNGPGASHVGIYLGDGLFISATRRQVEIQSLTLAYWQNAYRGSRRIVNR